MSSSAYKLLENEYALMTPEERKLLIEILRLMAEQAMAKMTPAELQVANAKLMGIATTSSSAN